MTPETPATLVRGRKHAVAFIAVALLGSWFFAALVMPTMNAFMSHRVSPDAQGELQGAVASLFSLAAIIGPPIMTHSAAGSRTRSGRGGAGAYNRLIQIFL